MGALENAIVTAARAKIRAFERHQKSVLDENMRRSRRSTRAVTPLKVERPALWDLDAAFDPYHVRSRASIIAHAIENKIRTGNYDPIRPGGFHVKKATGEDRLVTAFAIADEVVSRRLYRSLLNKNRARLSARSYAYRDDLGVHDAIAHLHSEWRSERRLFVAQYDFTDYFGSLSHDHVWKTINDLGLVATRTERRLISRFLRAPLPYTNARERAAPATNRTQGVHQGTSISLLLANIAAAPLDRELERLGVSFVRYADDLIVWSREYDSLTRAVDELYRFAERAGCSINQQKSPGVRLLVTPGTTNAEIQSADHVEYLSHSIGLRDVRLSDRSLERLKEQILAQLFNHLLREPLAGKQDLSRVMLGLDRDYVAYIWQLRRLLYGNVSEEQLRRLLARPLPSGLRLSGTLSRFPLVTDINQLRNLDSWISTQTWLALRRRSQVLRSRVFLSPDPWDRDRGDLLTFQSRSSRTGAVIDARLPSAVRMSELIRRAVQAHGSQTLGSTTSLYGGL